jgi:CRISPR-associated protein Cas1
MRAGGEPLAIRMVNEYVYCPRLFCYETVEGLFVHNADTVEGAAVHRRVDAAMPGKLDAGVKKRARGAGAAGAAEVASDGARDGLPEDEPEEIHARSVSLYSRSLHVTGKLDLVEGMAVEGGVMLYTPVEYKKGRPREGDGGRELWDADRVQLMLQILLLRENGFPSEAGIVFYKETRQRVTFRPAEEDEAWARGMVAAARAAQSGPMPAPLEHSPKCPRCSLVSICLPDETRLLAGGLATELLSGEDQLELGLMPEETAEPRETDRPALIEYVLRMPAPGIRRVKADPEMRRLIAPNPETRTLYLNTPGAWVGKSGETLTVKEKEKLTGEFLLKDLHHVALFGPVQISTGAVQSLIEAEIPLTYFSTGGWFYGLTRGHSLKNVLTRIEQFRAAGNPAASLALARKMIHGKIVNQRTLMMRNHLEPPREVLHGMKYFAHAALMAGSLPQLLGIEGNAAGLYFGAFGGLIKRRASDNAPESSTDDPLTEHRAAAGVEGGGRGLFPFYTDTRNRRPPRDPVNALLSLTYSLLAKECTLACYAVGLDPYVGFMHQPRHGRPALALDVMEEFRPLLADSTVITLLNNGMLTERDFILSRESAALTPAGRKAVFSSWERRLADGVTHPLFGYKVSYRRAVELQVRLLAKFLTGEIRDYVPFMTR